MRPELHLQIGEGQNGRCSYFCVGFTIVDLVILISAQSSRHDYKSVVYNHAQLNL